MRLILICCAAVFMVSCSNQGSQSTGSEGSIAGARPVGTTDSAATYIDVVASNLDVPWEIIWGPDDWIWYTEKGGSISKLNPETGEIKLLLDMPEVLMSGTKGLLCMALHPDFEHSPYVVVNYHYMKDRHKKKDYWSAWVRFTYDGQTLKDPFVYFEETAEAGHNGSRVTFAPDGTIFMAVGDGDSKNDDRNSGVAQNMEMPGGKVLRYNLDGTIPDDNPFPGSPVWALGFRVPQGMVLAPNGNLYTSEHGHQTDDEVNLVRKGHNYGYPNVRGVCDQPGEMDFCAKHNVQPPLMAWTPTLGPSGLAYYNHDAIPQWKNSLLLVTLKTQSLRVLKLNERGDSVIREDVYLEEMFGRLRDVCVAPNGDVYLATGNRDWTRVEGFPMEKDDRIIRLSPGAHSANAVALTASTGSSGLSAGTALYKSYCASCHQADGNGLAGSFPSLRTSARVKGEADELIGVLLNGQQGGKFESEMPGFAFLSDGELATLTEFVRREFGNKPGEVTPEQVQALRPQATAQ